MASKRILKKNINVLTGELLNECFAFSYFHPETKPKQVKETMWALAHTRNELISRMNRNVPKSESEAKKIKSFYKTLRADMTNMPSLLDHFA
ncbi:MAG: hypothetical protein LBQ60_00420 [Bacteroidales bacterium]|jgi:hypothetical protein|nr:hypothetical protein [Bacteroidales bacterium]